ncbi:MAG: PAS domain-containing sensor histidine kinase [Phycisphaerales bacterium]
MPPTPARLPIFRLRPVHIALLYTLLAVTWILVSDRLLRGMADSTILGLPGQTVKGVGFVVASGVLIFFLTASATRQAARAAERAVTSEQKFRRMADNIPGAIFRYTLLPDGSDELEYMSPGCRDIWEIDPETVQRSVKPLWDMVHPDDVAGLRTSVEHSASHNAPWSHLWRIATPSGAQKWLRGYGKPERQPDGSVMWDSVIFDVTAREEAQRAARRASRRLEHILQNITDGFYLLDHDWKYTTVNRAGAAAVGMKPEDMAGRSLFDVFPEVRGTEWEHAFDRVMKTGEPASLEARYAPLDRWFDTRISATDDGVAVFFRDVSDRKRAEQHQQMMMRELDHRVKNNLAAVLAIAESSLREAESLVEFSDSFVGRIRAMASMHSLLAAQRWEGIGLVSLIHAVVAPYTDRDGNRLEISGPDIRLPSDAAPALCMTLHELATNAAKHGALANSHGTIHLDWTIDDQTHDLRMVWSERDGPPTAATIEPGFGMNLLQGVIPYELNGQVDLEFTARGLDVTLFIPGIAAESRSHASSH